MWVLVELKGARITLLVVLFLNMEFWVVWSIYSRKGSSPISPSFFWL